MVDGHFGVNVGEFMVRRVYVVPSASRPIKAAGVAPIAHASGGPLKGVRWFLWTGDEQVCRSTAIEPSLVAWFANVHLCGIPCCRCLDALQWGSRTREEKQQSRGGVDWLCKDRFVRRLWGGGFRRR